MQNKITQAYKKNLVGVASTDLYMHTAKGQTLDDLSDGELRRGMCCKSAGSVSVCRRCGAPCTVGRILMRREDASRAEPPSPPVTPPQPRKGPPSDANAVFRRNFEQIYRQSGVSQSEIARRLDTRQCNISNWLTGRNVPTLSMLARLCRALDVSADMLLGLEVTE